MPDQAEGGRQATEPEPTSAPAVSEKKEKLSKVERLLERMRSNPKGDWKILDVEKICKYFGVNCNPPRRGSHYTVSSEVLEGALTVPARRPIKPPYIKRFVALIDTHNARHTRALDDG